jgi:WhiB family redox-sensing transcriptional regulator
LLEETWIRQGNFRNVPMSLMFPSDGAGVEVARQVCEGCPVRVESLEYALARHVPDGVWGGTSERERRRIARSRRLGARLRAEPGSQPAPVAETAAAV